MNDDDTNPLAGLDLDAWAAPPPPGGLADRVVARVAATDEAIAVVARRRRVKRRWWLAGGLTGALAAASVALLVIPHGSPDSAGSGTLVATQPQQLALGGATANLDPGADVAWQRSGDAIHVAQRAGSATWKVERDEHLVLEVGAAVASHGDAVSIDASNTTFRVETRMNLSDTRVIGVTAATAAAVALVSVIVYEGHVKVSGAGQTIVVERGGTVEVVPGQPPRELDNVAGVPVMPVVPPVMPTPPGPPVSAEPLPELIVPIGERITIHDPRGEIRVAVDPQCPGKDALMWPQGSVTAMHVGEATFSYTCHGIQKHGAIKLVKDPGFGVLIAPVDGAVGSDTMHLIGAAVPARAQVTIDSTAVDTQNKMPWATDVPYRDVLAVRIDAGIDDIDYYIRRLTRPLRGYMNSTSIDQVFKLLEPRLLSCVKHRGPGQYVFVDVMVDGSTQNLKTTVDDAASEACLIDVLKTAHFPNQTQPHISASFVLDPGCDARALVEQGNALMVNSEYATALVRYDAAIDCKYDEHSIELGFFAACDAHNVKFARKYWKRLSADSKPKLLQICVRNRITEDQLSE